MRSGNAVQPVEHALPILLRDSRPAVLNAHHQRLRLASNFDIDLPGLTVRLLDGPVAGPWLKGSNAELQILTQRRRVTLMTGLSPAAALCVPARSRLATAARLQAPSGRMVMVGMLIFAAVWLLLAKRCSVR